MGEKWGINRIPFFSHLHKRCGNYQPSFLFIFLLRTLFYTATSNSFFKSFFVRVPTCKKHPRGGKPCPRPRSDPQSPKASSWQRNTRWRSQVRSETDYKHGGINGGTSTYITPRPRRSPSPKTPIHRMVITVGPRMCFE